MLFKEEYYFISSSGIVFQDLKRPEDISSTKQSEEKCRVGRLATKTGFDLMEGQPSSIVPFTPLMPPTPLLF